MSLNYNLDEKIAKKQKSLRALKKKYSLKKRQQRKIKLIKVGTLFFIADLLEESQEKMVAYLEKYLLLDDSKKKEFFQVGSELLAKENESFYEKHPEFSRKKILFLMIRKAALLEKLKIQMEDPKVILGYLSHYKFLSGIEKKELEKRGYELFIKDNNQNRESTISDEEKLKLLKLSIQNNIDILSRMLKRNGKYGLAEVYMRCKSKGYTRSFGSMCRQIRKKGYKKAKKKRKSFTKYSSISGSYLGEKAQIDIKYVPIESIKFPTYGKRYYQITAIDEFSRKRVLEICDEKSSYETGKFLEKLEEKMGFPIKTIQLIMDMNL